VERDFYGIIILELKKDTEFYHQLQEVKAHNETLPEEIKYPTYQSPDGVVWSSKPINTQQITQQLATLNISRQLEQDSKQIELVIPNTITEIAEIPAESSIQAQIQIPPKSN